jgi:hypothetical protein
MSVRNLLEKVNIYAVLVPDYLLTTIAIQARLRYTKSASWPHQDASDVDRGHQFQSSAEGTCDKYSIPDPPHKDEENMTQPA